MFAEDTPRPSLTDAGVKQYVTDMLRQCHRHRAMLYEWALNVGLILAAGLAVVGVIWFRRRSRLSPEEEYEKELAKRKLVLGYVRNFQDARRIADNVGNITGMPADWG